MGNASKFKMEGVDDYFARLPSQECAERAEELIENYYSEAAESGRLILYRTSFFDYYQGFIVKGQLQRKGTQGEQVGVTINNYHNFIKHRVTMACQQKIAYEPQTTDSSSKALDQIRLAKGLLSLYSDRPDIDLSGKLRKATQFSQMFMESFLTIRWDQSKGNPVAMDTESGELVPEGDIDIQVKDPLSIVRDVDLGDSSSDQWWIIRDDVPKVELAVQYPQFESEIMSDTLDDKNKNRRIYHYGSGHSDICWVWTLIHKPTLAVPAGRLMKFISSETVLEDGPLPKMYGDGCVHRMAAEDLAGSPWGYTDAMDAIPICDAISRLHSTVLTNNVTFGLQKVLIAEGTNITESELGMGLTTLSWPAEKGIAFKPEAMNLTKSAPETYEYINTLTQTAGTLMGINEVSRGNPDLILKGTQSGASLALMSTQSIQFNSDLGEAYNSLAERAGTAIIKILSEKAVVPRSGRMIGMSGKFYSKQFSGSDLEMIDKVIVKTGNPLAQTTSGRLQIADSLQAAGYIKNHQDYLQVLETGNLEPMLEGYEQEISLIKDENDAMGDGPIPDAVVFDDHVTHLAEHKILLSSVEARKNPKLVMSVTKHIQSHLDFLAGNAQHGPMNPILASVLNQPTLPMGTPSAILLPKPQVGAPPQAGPGPQKPMPKLQPPQVQTPVSPSTNLPSVKLPQSPVIQGAPR